MNFVQMVINQIESGDTNNALLTAVDLLDDIRFGNYDDVETGNLLANLQNEMAAKHSAEVEAVRESAYKAGHEKAREDVARKLGLVA